MPEGKLLAVEATLAALHTVSHPSAGVTKKTLSKPDSSYLRPNEGSKVKLSVEVRGQDGTVYEPRQDVEVVLDEEQVSRDKAGDGLRGNLLHCVIAWVKGFRGISEVMWSNVIKG